jgi:molecular chaperone GrpE
MEFEVVDKRHFANVESIPVESLPEEKPRYPSFVEELMARVAATERRFEEKKKELDEEIARTKARLEADYGRRLEIATHNVLLPLLDVLDNLERATAAAAETGSVESLLNGVKLTVELFRARLQSLGVEPIPVLDQPFDPNISQAVGVVELSDPSRNGIVVEEALPGYRMGGQLLRAAQVRVGRIRESE